MLGCLLVGLFVCLTWQYFYRRIVFSLLGLLILAGTGLEAAKYILKMLNDTEEGSKNLHKDDASINGGQGDGQPETMITANGGQIQNDDTVDVPDNITLVAAVKRDDRSSFTSKRLFSVSLNFKITHILEFRLDGTKINGENEASC